MSCAPVGGLSGIAATCVIQPLDIVKVRAFPDRLLMGLAARGEYSRRSLLAARTIERRSTRRERKITALRYKKLRRILYAHFAAVLFAVIVTRHFGVQVRLQMAGGGSPFAVASEIVKKDGFGALYTGLGAGILRQITYTSSRLGIFKCASNPASSFCNRDSVQIFLLRDDSVDTP